MINLSEDLLKKNLYQFENLIKNNENYENYLSKYFFIIIYNLINKNINTELTVDYFYILLKNGLQLYELKNIKKTLELIKENNYNNIYNYLILYYKRDKYKNKIDNLIKIYKNSNGYIKEYFLNKESYEEINNIICNKIDIVLNSFDDKKFFLCLKSELNSKNKTLINEMINRLKQLYLFFGSNVFIFLNLKVVTVSFFLKLNKSIQLSYYQNYINCISCFNNILKNDFYIYSNILKKISNLEEFHYKVSINDYNRNIIKECINDIINEIEKKLI
jgi:hypothetical protein